MSLFYSKSKDLELRYLSNFERFPIKYKDKLYPSVEHGFQGLKYNISNCISIGKKFEIGNEYDQLDGNEIKKLGGKGGFKRNKCELDIKKWNEVSFNIMKMLIESRYYNDNKFRDILNKHDKLFHFERSGEKSYWGGNWKKGDERIESKFRGKNMLAKIMTKIKE